MLWVLSHSEMESWGYGKLLDRNGHHGLKVKWLGIIHICIFISISGASYYTNYESLSRLVSVPSLLVWVWNCRNPLKALILDLIVCVCVVSNTRTCRCSKKRATPRVWSGCGTPSWPGCICPWSPKVAEATPRKHLWELSRISRQEVAQWVSCLFSYFVK